MSSIQIDTLDYGDRELLDELKRKKDEAQQAEQDFRSQQNGVLRCGVCGRADRELTIITNHHLAVCTYDCSKQLFEVRTRQVLDEVIKDKTLQCQKCKRHIDACFCPATKELKNL